MKFNELKKQIIASRSDYAKLINIYKADLEAKTNTGAYSDKFIEEYRQKALESIKTGADRSKARYTTMLREAETEAIKSIEKHYMTFPTEEHEKLLKLLDRADLDKAEVEMIHDKVSNNYQALREFSDKIDKNYTKYYPMGVLTGEKPDDAKRDLTTLVRVFDKAINSLDVDPDKMSYEECVFFLGDDTGVASTLANIVDGFGVTEKELEAIKESSKADEEPQKDPNSVGEILQAAINEAYRNHEIVKAGKLNLIKGKYFGANMLNDNINELPDGIRIDIEKALNMKEY